MIRFHACPSLSIFGFSSHTHIRRRSVYERRHIISGTPALLSYFCEVYVVPLSIPVPAIAAAGNPNYQQFGVFLTPNVLRQVLGHDPRDNKRRQLKNEQPALAGIYESVQRPMTRKRRNGLVPYISQRMLAKVKGPAIGVLPALMLEFTATPMFIPINPNVPDGPGTLHLSLSEDELKVLIDGADVVVRVAISAIFVNCSRYVHKYQRISASR